MDVKLEILYEDKKKNRIITVQVKTGLKAARLMNAIDRAVDKAIGNDPDWTRWNLLDIVE